MPYLIFSDYSKPSLLEKTVSFLDFCLYLGGKQSYIVARDPQNKAWSVTVPGQVLSTFEKVLRILCLLVFIPITIIALAIRFLLYAYLSYKGRIVCLDNLVSKEERKLLILYPQVLQNIRRLPLVYTSLPLEDCYIAFNSLESSEIDDMSFWIDYPSLSTKMDFFGIQIPKDKLKKVKKSPHGEPTDFPINFPLLCREILKTELGEGEIVSQKGIEKLSRLFLAFLVYRSQKNANGKIETIIPLDSPDALWAKLLFFDYLDENPLTKGLLGSRVLKELERLGVLKKPEIHQYSMSKVVVNWQL
ncbi:Family of unknown function (DUF648) [Chlamydia poikilotherma]|uniref:DUF648 domain-containing protein n=1 Tax=Chlamydia poikilotherma TaxID=1967783 RepID=A0A3B0PST0_9CHLA|nr:DUF648 domain-containing protein [Chlamydia poikilotherma]SYX09041.1 Family of unknown function (DUF648) [Chlamydia poikilotherma]